MNIFAISLSMSAVIVALLLLSKLSGKRVSAKWRYIAWLVIGVRLLLPFHFTLPQAPVQLPSAPHVISQAPVLLTESIDAKGEVAQQEPLREEEFSLSRDVLIAAVWGTGAALFLLYHYIGYALFQKNSRRWRTLLKKGKPPVYLSKKIASPMLVGFFKPVIYLPQKEYQDEELSLILAHETVHYKRHDTWYKLVLLLANAVHWFNPFVYMMVHFANLDMELSCDEQVTKSQDIHFRKAYSQTILCAGQKKDHIPLSTCFNGGKKEMKQRFIQILNQNKKRRGIVLLLLVLVLTLTIGLWIGWGGGKQVYQNRALGFSVTLPADCSGEYTILEDGEVITFSHKEIHEKYGNGTGDIFYIQRMEGELTELPEWSNGQSILAAENGYTYLFGIPTDVRAPVWEGSREQTLVEEYQRMSDEAIQTVKQTFSVLETDGSIPASDITRLYEYRATGISDAERINALVPMADFTGLPIESVKKDDRFDRNCLAITYRVENRSYYRFFDETKFDRTAALLFALIPEAEEIRYTVYDQYALDADDMCMGSYYNRWDFTSRSNLAEFTEEYIGGAAQQYETFKEYYEKVANLPSSQRGNHAYFTERYHLIGNDCEIVINSGIHGVGVLTPEVAALVKKNIGVDDFDTGKKLMLQLYDVRNFKTNEVASWAWLYTMDEANLNQPVDLIGAGAVSNRDEYDRMLKWIMEMQAIPTI